MCIEIAGSLVLCRNEHSTDTGDVGDVKSSTNRIDEKGGAKAPALPGTINRQAGQKQYRDWKTWEAFGKTFGSIIINYIANDQCMKADNFLLADGQIGL